MWIILSNETVTCKEQLTTETEHKQKLEQSDSSATPAEGNLPKHRSSKSTKSQCRLTCNNLVITGYYTRHLYYIDIYGTAQR